MAVAAAHLDLDGRWVLVHLEAGEVVLAGEGCPGFTGSPMGEAAQVPTQRSGSCARSAGAAISNIDRDMRATKRIIRAPSENALSVLHDSTPAPQRKRKSPGLNRGLAFVIGV